jgi:hypothetical protein
MSTVTVSSTAGLLQALSGAQSGDTILLAAGSYSNVLLQNFNFTGNVTITSADPTHRAMLSDLQILRSSGITLSGVELNANAASFSGLTATQVADPYPFRVTNSDRITLDHNYIHGSLDNDPSNDRSGLMVANSTHVTAEYNEFQQLSFGIAHSMSTYVDFSNNYFHEIRSDGIHGSSSYATITNNYFTNFSPAVGDHPDSIQFFAENTTSAPHDLLISGNVYVRGSGSPIEGIFLRLVDSSPLKFTNVQITDNLIAGATMHGVTVLGGQNLTVEGNTIVPFADYTSTWVWIGNSIQVQESNNTAGSFIYGSTTNTSWTPTTGNTNITVSNDVVGQVAVDGGLTALSAWLALHPDFNMDPLAVSTGATGATGSTDVKGGTTVDATAPPPPTDLSLDPSTDSGVVGDNITQDTVVRIDGKVTEGGTTVSLLSGETTIGSTTADSTGSFSLVCSMPLTDGLHELQAISTSTSGIASSASSSVSVTIDSVAPTSDLIDFSLTRSGKSETVHLAGTASDNLGGAVAVSLYRDGTLVHTDPDGSGGWSFSDTTNAHVHTYTVKSTDVAGNVADASHSLVLGSSSAENVKGTSGSDLIWGAGGADNLTGGGGADTFIYTSAGDAPLPSLLKNGKFMATESITDFASGDKIDLSALGHLTFDGQSSSAHSHAIDWYMSGGNTFVIADVNGDNRADMMIQLVGAHQLSASDFMLG